MCNVAGDIVKDRAARIMLGMMQKQEGFGSALHFLRPVDYCRGKPVPLLEKRRRKLAEARHCRKERDLELRQ